MRRRCRLGLGRASGIGLRQRKEDFLNAPSSLGQSIVTRKSGSLPAAADSRRPIVVVLGMHRSGTSLCSHILSMLGVDMADDLQIRPSNAKGHWERPEIVGLQDEIYALLDRDFSSPQQDFPLPTAWWAEPKVRAVQSRIETFLAARMPATGLFGFKDPRTARLLPLWLQLFKNLNLAPRFVLCLRAPSQIARSLKQRDGLDPATGEYRALACVSDCFRYVPGHELHIVDYEKWFDNYADNLHGLMDFLAIEWEQSEADLAAAVTGIVERDLRHSDESLGVARQPLIRSFYNLVAGLRTEPARRIEIDHFVNQFVAFQQLLGPFESAQRAYVAVAARVPELEARIAELEAASRTGEIASRERERALGEALASAAGERDAARAELAETVLALASSNAKSTEIVAALHAYETRDRDREQALQATIGERAAAHAALARTTELLADSEAKAAEFGRTLEAAELNRKEHEQALQGAIGERDAARTEMARTTEPLSASEARTAELALALQAARAISQEREREATELLTGVSSERDVARAELVGARERLAASEARLTDLDASWRPAAIADEQREQALRQDFARHERELEAAKSELLGIRRSVQHADETNRRLNDELSAAHVAHSLAHDQVRRNEERLAGLEAELRTGEAAMQQREKTFDESFAKLNGEIEAARGALSEAYLREQDLRASNEAARQRFEAQLRELRDQFIDVDTALARSKAREDRTPLFKGSRRWERTLARSGLFDAEWYVDQYKDAIEGGLSPIRHYLQMGYLKGSRPNPLFDTRWYLERYDDVRRSGANPLVHYLMHGAEERRDPSAHFDTAYYLDTNPDVRESGMNPVAHYLQYGRHEGRLSTRRE
jgi:hypothetical protein